MDSPEKEQPVPDPAPQAGQDYYIENGRWVFTAQYLLKRGRCCGSGCRHCPYRPAQKSPKR